jgi:hypothetical protein
LSLKDALPKKKKKKLSMSFDDAFDDALPKERKKISMKKKNVNVQCGLKNLLLKAKLC